MAATNFGVNSPLAVKLWAKKLNVEALKATWISKFMGEGTDSVIQHKTDMEKSAGDRLTIGLRACGCASLRLIGVPGARAGHV
jgi:hypothetical protein